MQWLKRDIDDRVIRLKRQLVSKIHSSTIEPKDHNTSESWFGQINDSADLLIKLPEFFLLDEEL